MNKIAMTIICVLFLTAGRIWAQGADAMANNVVANEVKVAVPVDNDNMENEAAVNDEGYGTDDEEYYGSENDMVNAEANAEEPVVDNAVGK